MPELPEVEVIRRELAPLIKGKTFARPLLEVATTIEYPEPLQFASSLEGRQVTGTGRKGKYLVIYLDRGILVVHLRMTGNLIYVQDEKVIEHNENRFLRLTLPFTDGTSLRYCDMRRFGRLWLVEDERELHEIVLRNIGPDIFDDLCCDEFVKLLAKRKGAKLKPLLLDQRFAAGMGNIYTDECLYRCGLHPERRAAELNRSEAEELYHQVRQVLTDGIKYGGTTFRDYRTSSGALGDFQSRLKVYGRKGETCACGTPIEKITVGGRGTYYCPRCQEPPKS